MHRKVLTHHKLSIKHSGTARISHLPNKKKQVARCIPWVNLHAYITTWWITMALMLGTCERVTVIILCVFVTALALTYDVCATNLAYRCSPCHTQKVLN